MGVGETASAGLGLIMGLIGDLAFRFVPATIAVISGSAPDLGIPNPTLTPITEPVTTMQVVTYLNATALPGTIEPLYDYWVLFVVISIALSLGLATIIIYSIFRIIQIRAKEEERFRAAAHPVAGKQYSKTQLRWNRIKEEIASDSDKNWRLAILEADIMLNDLLDSLAYKGETMADKMKQVDRGDWRTIDLAWEAHKARNAIAHEGAQYPLNDREAQRIINLYERVFREFKFID